MATYANLDLRVEVNSVNLSGWATSVSLPFALDELDSTAFGQTGRTRKAGLADVSATINFNQDFAASAVDATVSGAMGSTVAMKVRPTTASIGSTNPEYVVSVLVSKYDPFGSNVGELAKTSVTWPMSDSDSYARNTS